MVYTSMSNGCKAYKTIRVIKRLIRGMNSSLDSEVQCKQAYVTFLSQPQDAATHQNGQ